MEADVGLKQQQQQKQEENNNELSEHYNAESSCSVSLPWQ